MAIFCFMLTTSSTLSALILYINYMLLNYKEQFKKNLVLSRSVQRLIRTHFKTAVTKL